MSKNLIANSHPQLPFGQVFETTIPSVLRLISGQSVKCRHTSNQADTLCLLDSSLQEREQIFEMKQNEQKKK
jgi:hypothetical protein